MAELDTTTTNAAPPPTAAPTPPPVTTDTKPADPAPTTATPTPTPSPFLESLEKAGIKITAKDEADALRQLAEAHTFQQAVSPNLDLIREFNERKADFEAWQRQRFAPPPPPPPPVPAAQDKPKAWWEEFGAPPEFDPSWERYLRVDEKGQVVEQPGCPPGTLQKYMAVTSYRQQQIEKFASNPFQFIEGPVKKLAADMIEEKLKSHAEQQRKHESIVNLEQQHASWVMVRDNQQQPVLDPITRQPILTPEGKAYLGVLTQMQQLGVKDVALANQLGLMAAGNVTLQAKYDALEAKLNSLNAGVVNQQKKTDFLSNGQVPNLSGSLTPHLNPATPPPPQNGRLSLEQMLHARLGNMPITGPEGV